MRSRSYRDFEENVRACYSTWGATYYDDYLGNNASYPPVHAELLKRLLVDTQVRRVLDAGCGPASFLRNLDGAVMDLYGFDVTTEMVEEGKRVFVEKGWNPDHIWEGSVVDAAAYFVPDEKSHQLFDVAVCIGVLPHVPSEHDGTVIKNLHGAVKDGGFVAIEARNQLFALYTLNRYSHEFFMNDLLRIDHIVPKAGPEKSALKAQLKKLSRHFRRRVPRIRRGKRQELGYDEVLSRTHNPLLIRQQMEDAGFSDIRLHFYHWHALPPMYGTAVPDLFRRESLALEGASEDWRGHFMASAFIAVGEKL